MYIVQWRFLGPDGPTVLSTLSGCFDACLMASFPLLHTHGGVVRPNIPNCGGTGLIIKIGWSLAVGGLHCISRSFFLKSIYRVHIDNFVRMGLCILIKCGYQCSDFCVFFASCCC